MNLKSLADSAYDFAKKQIDGKSAEDEMTAMFLALLPSKEIAVIVTPFGDDDQKQAVAVGLRRMFRDKGVTAYIHLSEAWMTTHPKDTDLSKTIRPSKSEVKKEVVIIAGEDIEGGTLYSTAEIERHMDGTRSLGKRETEKMQSLGGRFATLLSFE